MYNTVPNVFDEDWDVSLVTAEQERCRVPRSGVVRPGRERRDEIDPTR
jgi:hypothetical protein